MLETDGENRWPLVGRADAASTGPGCPTPTASLIRWPSPDPTRPVQIFICQNPQATPSAQVLRMLRNCETILAAYLKRPLRLRSLPLASG